ncbi:MAG: hypothetical protein WA002_02620, partial [Candidatus Acidiferrales bacterium]
FDVIGASFENPIGIRAPMQIRNLAGVGAFGIANPDPNETMLFRDGINRDGCVLVNALLAGHPDALAAFVKFEAVVFADEVIALQISLGEREEAMGATILEGRDCAIGLAIKNDVLATNRAVQRGVLDFMIPGGWVPEISQEHYRSPRMVACFTK